MYEDHRCASFSNPAFDPWRPVHEGAFKDVHEIVVGSSFRQLHATIEEGGNQNQAEVLLVTAYMRAKNYDESPPGHQVYDGKISRSG